MSVARETPQRKRGQTRNINIMTMQRTDPTVEQPNADESDIDTAINAKCVEIRALLPGLKRTVEAFGELHDVFDQQDQVGDFDGWCRHEFGVVPELLLEATERL